MDLGIAGRRAIVCASSKGLGRACAEALAREGVAVTINGRNGETLAARFFGEDPDHIVIEHLYRWPTSNDRAF